jgi:hypothetical protein
MRLKIVPTHLVEEWGVSEKTACGVDALGLPKTANPKFVTCKRCLRHVRRVERFSRSGHVGAGRASDREGRDT